MENKFYIFKERARVFTYGTAYNIENGETISQSATCIIEKHGISKARKIEMSFSLRNSCVTMLKWNRYNVYLGYEIVSNALLENVNIKCNISKDVYYIAFMFDDVVGQYHETETENIGYEINPHYKKLEKCYKKENNQLFFRESLDGKVNLFGLDYQLIKDASLEETLYFKIYKNNVVYATASFNKSDCGFNHAKKSVELKLDYNDKYSKILNASENKYDLIKLAPDITQLTMTKRCVMQLYIQGENVISNYAGGTYWETEVLEPVYSSNLLLSKYFFSPGLKFIEINLKGFNSAINSIMVCPRDSDCWNSTIIGDDNTWCSIKFRKIYDAGYAPSYFTGDEILKLSDGISSDMTYYSSVDLWFINHDAYRIEIYTGKDASGVLVYQSEKLFGKDLSFFTLSSDPSAYKMVNATPGLLPTYFNLGAYVIEYPIWGRILCDVPFSSDGLPTYPVPSDDFAVTVQNYRRCIGLTGFNSDDSVVKIVQTKQTSIEPTSYGQNDYGEYFDAPQTLYQQYYHPLSKSAWGNTSLWVELYELSYPQGGYEVFCRKYYRKYILQNSYHISDVIKALLAKIDPTITHEKRTVYSQFLYGHSVAISEALGACDIYITQKTNVLKGEYDQAAQKAEIKFKQIMEMLRDCFRCYWFIDDENRLRIEHVSYFMNGMSYSRATSQINLSEKYDKFNKIKSLYCQQAVEFDKSLLSSRLEFAWMDDSTKAMGGDLKVDITNKYVQKDKTDEINVDQFTSDIDYMLFLPEEFSKDGFALIMADGNLEVPIVRSAVKEEIQHDRWNIVDVQNWYASFNQLINHYMLDMPGNLIECNNITAPSVSGVKKCMKHVIEFPSSQINININRLITTEIGNGYIERVSTDIDTEMTEVELRYDPE